MLTKSKTKRTMRTISLPYHNDSAILAAKLHTLPWFAFLDSCKPQTDNSRYDIITALPYQTWVTQGATTTISDEKGQTQTISTANPFALLKDVLLADDIANTARLPFIGGAMGFFGYELAQLLEPSVITTPHNTTPQTIPDMAIGLYDWAIIIDHEKQYTCCVIGDIDDKIEMKLNLVLSRLEQDNTPTSTPFQLTRQWQSNMCKTDYANAFNRIQDYIHAGDCYQVNLTQCFDAAFTGDPWHAYNLLRNHNPNPFSAFLRYPQFQIASLSPEQFLSVNDRSVETKPIKGTSARSCDQKIDNDNALALLASTKNQAENLMIVDLLRNDLSKHCAPHSVHVTKLFELASYPGVHHLVSTIRATLEKDTHVCDLLADCFPGGSITGAPKIRAMQIIDECEPHRRGVYCGSIGYLSRHERMDTNIAIRTLTFCDDTVTCPAGGAIVADSVVNQEYNECLDKVAAIFNALLNLHSR